MQFLGHFHLSLLCPINWVDGSGLAAKAICLC